MRMRRALEARHISRSKCFKKGTLTSWTPASTHSLAAMLGSIARLFLCCRWLPPVMAGSCGMSFATLNLEAGFPTVDDARRRLVSEMQAARARGVRVIKVVHGWGSSGEGGKLGPAIRKSLRLRVKEGKASFVLPGERFSSDSNEGREFVQRHPALRKDRDYNRANPGITLVELTP